MATTALPESPDAELGTGLGLLLTETLFTGEVAVVAIPSNAPTSALARGDVILFVNGYEAISAQEVAEQIKEADELKLIVRPAVQGGVMDKLGLDIATAWASSVFRMAFYMLITCAICFLMPVVLGALSYQAEASRSKLQVQVLQVEKSHLKRNANLTQTLLQKKMRMGESKLTEAIKKMHEMELQGANIQRSHSALSQNHSQLEGSYNSLLSDTANLRAELEAERARQATMKSTLDERRSEYKKELDAKEGELSSVKTGLKKKETTMGHQKEHEQHLGETLKSLMALEETFKNTLKAAKGELEHATALIPSPPPPPFPPPPPPPIPRQRFIGHGTIASAVKQQSPSATKPWERPGAAAKGVPNGGTKTPLRTAAGRRRARRRV